MTVSKTKANKSALVGRNYCSCSSSLGLHGLLDLLVHVGSHHWADHGSCWDLHGLYHGHHGHSSWDSGHRAPSTPLQQSHLNLHFFQAFLAGLAREADTKSRDHRSSRHGSPGATQPQSLLVLSTFAAPLSSACRSSGSYFGPGSSISLWVLPWLHLDRSYSRRLNISKCRLQRCKMESEALRALWFKARVTRYMTSV